MVKKTKKQTVSKESELGYDPDKKYPLEAFIEVNRKINHYEIALLKLEVANKMQTISDWEADLSVIMKRPAN